MTYTNHYPGCSFAPGVPCNCAAGVQHWTLADNKTAPDIDTRERVVQLEIRMDDMRRRVNNLELDKSLYAGLLDRIQSLEIDRDKLAEKSQLPYLNSDGSSGHVADEDCSFQPRVAALWPGTPARYADCKTRQHRLVNRILRAFDQSCFVAETCDVTVLNELVMLLFCEISPDVLTMLNEDPAPAADSVEPLLGEIIVRAKRALLDAHSKNVRCTTEADCCAHAALDILCEYSQTEVPEKGPIGKCICGSCDIRTYNEIRTFQIACTKCGRRVQFHTEEEARSAWNART